MATADITSLVIEVKSQGIKEASTALSGLGTSAANAEKRINSLIEAAKRLNTINETAAKAFVNVADKMREQDKLLSNMAANSRTSARGVQDLAAAMLLLSTSLNLMNQNIQRTTVSTRAHNESMREAHALARGLSGSLGALWLTYGNLAGMSVGVAIGAGLKGIISVGKDVENTLEGIRVRAGESRESMNQVAEAVERIGKGVYGPQEVAKAFETLALAGLKAKESTLAIGAALNLATAGGTSIEKAAESLVTIGTAVGATAKSFDMLADGITAAANSSLASVDSIAESVKRASVVNKLYGASFDDILTQTAALAQLGIKNTAAGTAIVNFYSNSLGQTEKSKKALDALGMSFTDLNGKAKPVVEAFEEFTEKLNKFDLKSQQTIINDIFGERALRDVEGLRDAVNRSADDTTKYANKLREIQGQIAEAAGTAALQSVQLGLTTSKQMESVGNTLKTSLSSAFTEIAPSIKIASDRLKEVFGSPEFVRQISNIAVAIANLTTFVVENYKALGYVVEAFLVWKTVTVGAGLFEMITRGLTGVAAAFGAVTVATNGAAVATGLLGRALSFLPGIGIILTGLTAAWALYNIHSGKAKDNAVAMADNYNKDFLKALEEEAKRLEKTNEVIAAGTAIKDADAIATRELALAKLKEGNASAIASAQAEKDAAQKEFRNKAIQSYTFDKVGSKEALALKTATESLTKAKEESLNTEKQAQALTDRIVAASTKKKEAYQAEAKAADDVAKNAAGTGKYGGAKVDKAGINDAYAASITDINNRIKSAKKDMQNFDDKLNDQFKAGEIGKLQVIQSTAEKQIAEYEKIGKEIQKQIDIASKGNNKKADVEKFSGLQEANTEAIEQAKRKQAQETSVYMGQLRQETARDQVKQFEEEGNYVKAAALRWSTDYAPAVQALQKDFEKYGDTIPEIKERMDQLNATQKAFLDSAAVREAEKAYQSLSKAVENMFLAAENASQGQGISGVVLEATKASEKYQNMLPGLTAELERFKKAAETSGDPRDAGKYEEALNNQMKLAGKYKSLWVNTGKAISDSLTTAFGKSGKAAGGVIEAMIAYQNTDNKNISAKNKLYGDAAESAKGFFSEGSKGYQIMDTVSKAFHAAELARTLAGMAPKIASGVASLFAQGGWAGFAGAAAFLALMASLGFAGGGGGSAPMSSEMRQKKNGTGSVLGDSDAKSESIANSLELIARDSGLGLVHFNSMDKSLKSLVAGIGGLSSLLVRGTNLTSKLPQDTISSVNKLFKDGHAPWSIGANMMSKVFGSIFGGKTSVEDVGIKMNAASLAQLSQSGANVNQYVDTKKTGGWFSSDKYKTTTTSLGSEINDQFGMIITSLADTVKSAAATLGFGGKEFEDKLSTFVVDLGEISTKGLTGDKIQEALETAFSKLGDDMAKFAIVGLEKFQKVGEGYLETVARLANDLIQVQDVFAVLGKTMNLTGLAAVEASQGLIAMFGSVDKLTEAAAYYVDNFKTDAEKLVPIQKSLNAELTRLKLSTNLTTDQYKALVEQQDLTTVAGQEMFAALMNIAPAMKAVGDAALDAAEKAKEAAAKLLEALMNTANSDFDVLSKSVEKSKAAAQAAYEAQAAILNAQISSLGESRKAIAELNTALEGALNTIKGMANGALMMSRTQAQANLSAALDDARKTGKLPSAADFKDTLAVLSKDPADSFSSYSDYIRDIGITAGKLSNLGDISGTQLTGIDKQIDIAQKQLEVAKKTLTEELTRLDTILDLARQQLDAMDGTTLAVRDLVGALNTFNASVLAAISAQTGVTGSNGKPIKSVAATSEDIQGLYKSILGREGEAEGIAHWEALAAKGMTASEIAASFLTSDEYKMKHPDGSHAGGLDYVPKDNYIARLHKGEKVLTAQQAQSSRNGSDMAAVVEAIENSCKETTAAIGPMQEDIRKLYKRIVDMSPSGDRLQTAEIGV